MPIRQVPAEVALRHEGPYGEVVVYHVYKNNNMDCGRRTFWFTLNPLEGEGSASEFDVRGLAAAAKFSVEERVAFYDGHEDVIRQVLRRAVESGELGAG